MAGRRGNLLPASMEMGRVNGLRESVPEDI